MGYTTSQNHQHIWKHGNDITANLRNMFGSPVLNKLDEWLWWMSMMSYCNMISECDQWEYDEWILMKSHYKNVQAGLCCVCVCGVFVLYSDLNFTSHSRRMCSAGWASLIIGSGLLVWSCHSDLVPPDLGASLLTLSCCWGRVINPRMCIFKCIYIYIHTILCICIYIWILK